jgi:capsular polysaccharide export protein
MTRSDNPDVTTAYSRFVHSFSKEVPSLQSSDQRVHFLGQGPITGAVSEYPGLAFRTRDAGAPLAAISGPGSGQYAIRLSGRGRPILRIRPGVLQTPPFKASAPWLSATVVSGARDGRHFAGSAEQALAAGIELPLARRAAVLADQIVNARIGGACWADQARLPGAGLHLVQASADPIATAAMIRAAVACTSASRVVVLVRAGGPPGDAARLAGQAAALGCQVLRGPFDPWSLLDHCAELHVADGAAIGFLALLAGRPVRCHAPAWLSGWGLTRDEPGIAPRPERRNLTELAAAALIRGASHANPFTGAAITAEAAADIAAEWRRVTDANRRIGSLTGMQFWKRPRLAEFLHSGTRAPKYVRSGGAAVAEAVRQGGAVASWSSRMPGDLVAAAKSARIPVVRIEDGFIRSVGLGSNFLPPCSVILDSRGIYYDPRQPSDLEHLLATVAFEPSLIARSSRLIDRLISQGVTKYNVGTERPVAFPAERRRILVPGQVANDLSVRLGGAGITDNADLLARVRAANPDAFIVYKPHPDVDAGHRPGAIDDTVALRFADAIVRDVSMARLIDAIDEVHTLTSLAGFEALLRRRRVVAWGQPFYAGWGLTHDMAPIARRNRILTIEQLAACVLLLYPRYIDPATGLPCPAEILMDRLAEPEHWRPGLLARLRRMQGLGHRRVGAIWREGKRMMTGRRQA